MMSEDRQQNWRGLTPYEYDQAMEALLQSKTATPECYREACEKTILIPTMPKLLGLHGPRAAIAHIALYQRASGITLGRKVYIRHDLFDAATADLPIDLVVHEVAHVVQYFRDGATKFLTKYLWEYARNLAKGMSDSEAYLAISYEKEARDVESRVRF